MAQIFYVTCPRCRQRFPCHPELWQVEYALLCPFCQLSFHQEESPLIVTATGEQRPGARFLEPTRDSRHSPEDLDPSSQAESM